MIAIIDYDAGNIKSVEKALQYIGEDTVNVVVATEGLTEEQAAQINEIVISESGQGASSVKIVEIKTKE